MIVAQINIKTTQGSIRPLSATAPVASATVMAENMPWYTANRRSGSLEDPTDGWANTPLNPKLAKSPMKGPAV